MQFSHQEKAIIFSMLRDAYNDLQIEFEARILKNKVSAIEFFEVLADLEKNLPKTSKTVEKSVNVIYNLDDRNIIQKYINDKKVDKLTEKKIKQMINTQYLFKIVNSTEKEVSSANLKLPSKFISRQKERTSFVDKNFRYDLTVVREKDLSSKVHSSEESYEIELELLHKKKEQQSSIDALMAEFISKMNYLLFKIQDSPEILGQIETNEVIKEYKTFLNQNILTKVISLSNQDLSTIETNYSVTEKADGQRMVLFIPFSSYGMVYLIQYIGSSLKVRKLNLISKENMGTILDGEFVKIDNGWIFLVFDILYFRSNNVMNLSHQKRLAIIQHNIKINNVFLKNFFFGIKKYSGWQNEASYLEGNIFALSKQVLNTKFNYRTDGLIFTPNEKYDKNINKIYKWKPVEDITIDFLVIKDKTHTTKWSLYVYNEGPRLFSAPNENLRLKFPDIATITVSQEVNKRFYDNSVIEFNWNGSSFQPIRSRPDKQNGNYQQVAISNFYVIIDPVTKATITGEKQFFEPLESPLTDRNKSATFNIRHFNNRVKEYLLQKYVPTGSYLIDFGSGKGGDIIKWLNLNLSVLGLDIVDENLKIANKRIREINKKHKTLFSIYFQKFDLASNPYFYQQNFENKTGLPDDDLRTRIAGDTSYITAFFSLTFFFETREKIIAFFSNLALSLKKGGLFIGIVFDGERVFNLLKNIDRDNTLQEKHFAITKKYRDNVNTINDLPIYGNELTCKLEETELRYGIDEYLVNWQHLEKVADSFQLKVVKTGYLDEFITSGDLDAVVIEYLLPEDKKFISLNRYFIFQKLNVNSYWQDNPITSTN